MECEELRVERSRLEQPLTSLKGIGPKTAERFASAGISTLEDLVTCYPRRYESFGEAKTDPDEMTDGQILAVCGFVEGKLTNTFAGRFRITSGKIRSGTQVIPVTWFNMPYLRNSLQPGKKYVFRGYVRVRGMKPRLSQPSVYDPDEYEQMTKGLRGVYPLRNGLKEGTLRRAVEKAFEAAGVIDDFLPEDLLHAYSLTDENDALRGIHFPGDSQDVLRARKRLVFDEFLMFILGLKQLKGDRSRAQHACVMPSDEWSVRLLHALPFSLTASQRAVWEQVEKDMCSQRAMARLVQGDVGSGKTVIAFLALAKAVENGGQGAVMVPTQVLANQHYKAFTALCEAAQLPIRAVLLTGNMTAARRRTVHDEIASGKAQVMIGTHALISEKVVYKNLTLVITDEQHRFGVRQREVLGQKGTDPHVLVMSATPIPRTLAVILYGDLDVSVINELPAGRSPIRNCVVDSSWRPNAYAFIRKEVQAGHQAYVICPMVEESEEVEASNVIDYAQTLKKALPSDVKIEYLHGRMSAAEKDAVMERFSSGQTQVLVSTTVVEVGVNVPNATVMMIEDAQRFGLAQLHQLRGRVGRGSDQSYCILVNTAPDGESRERLEILKHSNDGFEIAAKDLELRGPGDLFGIRQSGLIDFRIGDVFTDAKILQAASEAADRIIKESDGLSEIKYRALQEKLQRYMNNGQAHINI